MGDRTGLVRNDKKTKLIKVDKAEEDVLGHDRLRPERTRHMKEE